MMKIKRPWKELLILLAMAGFAGLATKAFHPLAPAFYLQNQPLAEDEVTWAVVQERWGGEVIWLDARQAAEYEKGHIPGAKLLNEQGWTDQLWEIWSVLETGTTPVVVYCDSRSCKASRKVADRLRQNTGREEIYILRGGWAEYRNATAEGG